MTPLAHQVCPPQPASSEALRPPCDLPAQDRAFSIPASEALVVLLAQIAARQVAGQPH